METPVRLAETGGETGRKRFGDKHASDEKSKERRRRESGQQRTHKIDAGLLIAGIDWVFQDTVPVAHDVFRIDNPLGGQGIGYSAKVTILVRPKGAKSPPCRSDAPWVTDG